MHHFNDAILPVLNFIAEYNLHIGKEKKHENSLEVIETNLVTILTFNPHYFGKRMIKFLAGSIINQMYIRAITEKFKVSVVFIINGIHNQRISNG